MTTVAILVVGWPGVANASVSWTILPTVNPQGASDSALSGIFCYSTSNCIAVGDYTDSSGTQLTLAENWNGTAWTIQPTPDPAGATSSRLAGIDCFTTQCIAVGGYTDSSGTQLTFAENWNGTAWTIQPTPDPAGATATFLNGVACHSAANCTAVGYYADSSGTQVTLAENWNGSTWVIQPTPNPGGASDSRLNGVNCTAQRNQCFAVGEYRPTPTTTTFTTVHERWTGTRWLVQTAPARQGLLTGISCTSATFCIAVGTASGPGGIGAGPLAEQWLNGAWTVQTTPGPSTTFLAGVSCGVKPHQFCTAVGQYTGKSGNQVAIAEHYFLGGWHTETTASPFGKVLNSVSCPQPTGDPCVADGYTLANLTTPTRTLAEFRSIR